MRPRFGAANGKRCHERNSRAKPLDASGGGDRPHACRDTPTGLRAARPFVKTAEALPTRHTEPDGRGTSPRMTALAPSKTVTAYRPMNPASVATTRLLSSSVPMVMRRQLGSP